MTYKAAQLTANQIKILNRHGLEVFDSCIYGSTKMFWLSGTTCNVTDFEAAGIYLKIC